MSSVKKMLKYQIKSKQDRRDSMKFVSLPEQTQSYLPLVLLSKIPNWTTITDRKPLVPVKNDLWYWTFPTGCSVFFLLLICVIDRKLRFQIHLLPSSPTCQSSWRWETGPDCLHYPPAAGWTRREDNREVWDPLKENQSCHKCGVWVNLNSDKFHHSVSVRGTWVFRVCFPAEPVSLLWGGMKERGVCFSTPSLKGLDRYSVGLVSPSHLPFPFLCWLSSSVIPQCF